MYCTAVMRYTYDDDDDDHSWKTGETVLRKYVITNGSWENNNYSSSPRPPTLSIKILWGRPHRRTSPTLVSLKTTITSYVILFVSLHLLISFLDAFRCASTLYLSFSLQSVLPVDFLTFVHLHSVAIVSYP